jgi:hypothetical protein
VLRSAAVAALLPGLGFGLPGVFAVVYFAKHDDVWTFLGFPTYGDGPFEHIGIHTTIPLLLAFCLVCAAEVALGVLLWKHQRATAAASKGQAATRCSAAAVSSARRACVQCPSGRISPLSSKRTTPLQSRLQPCSR